MGLGIKKGLLVAGLLCLAACGGDSNDDVNTPVNGGVTNPDPVDGGSTPIEPEDARVVRMGLDVPFIPLGGVGILSVEPTYAESRVAAGEHVVVVVKLPPGVAYQEESSSIQTDSGSQGVSALPTPCGDGSTLITYDLSSAQLDGAKDPDGLDDADARLFLGLEGVSNTAAASIEAAAADNALQASCGSGFDAESDVTVAVQ